MGLRWYFTQDTLKALQELSGMQLTFTQAANYLGTTGELIRAKASEAGYESQLEALYPPSDRRWTSPHRSGIRKLKPEEIAAPLEVDREHIYVRSASMPWRKCA